MSDYHVQLIRNTRLRFGEPPRVFPRGLGSYLKIRAPSWMRHTSDKMIAIYEDQQLLLTQGRVVWGSVVQANTDIFVPGKLDLPGVVVYSPEFHRHDDLVEKLV